MKVVLMRDVEGLGPAGTIREVKEGYARNFLIPRGLAKEATNSALRILESQKQTVQQRTARERTEAERLAAALEQVVIAIPVRAGEGGRLFGSVTAADIADALAARGLKISKKQIELADPIKVAGFFKVPVRIGQHITAHVDVNVVGEG